MINKSRLAIVIIAGFLAIGPILADHRLTAKYDYYKDLQETYECQPAYPRSDLYQPPLKECAGDFADSGKTTVVVLNEEPERGLHFKKINILYSGKNLLKLAYSFHGPEEAVHLAVHNESGLTRLIVRDEVAALVPITEVFALDGNKMTKTSPSQIESDILYALGMKNGKTALFWDSFFTFRKPVLFAYYSFMFAIAYLLLRRRKPFVAGFKTKLTTP